MGTVDLGIGGGAFGNIETKTFGSCDVNPPPPAPTPPVTPPPVRPSPTTASPVTPSPTASPTSPPTTMCKVVNVEVTDSSGVTHNVGPITLAEGTEVKSLDFNVVEEGFETCPE